MTPLRRQGRQKKHRAKVATVAAPPVRFVAGETPYGEIQVANIFCELSPHGAPIGPDEIGHGFGAVREMTLVAAIGEIEERLAERARVCAFTAHAALLECLLNVRMTRTHVGVH
jgi:hypothetical protein